MTRQEILNRVIEIVESYGSHEYTEQSSLNDIDSLDITDMILKTEIEFNLHYDKIERNIDTVKDLVDLIYENLKTITKDKKDIKKIKENLVYDLRDFVQSRKFSDVVFGLSGGMDSALVLALAAEALGPQHVHTFMMATKNTSGLSIELAKQLSANIGNPHKFIDIQPRVDCALKTLPFVPQRRTTVENIQARIRGDICMTFSNEYDWMVLGCGNKSEAAMGYCTLYGDTCGAVMPLGDLYKTDVYKMAELYPAIPQAIIIRAPSAELSPNQYDSDSLPEYAVLDPILQKIESGVLDENEQMAEIRRKYNAMAFKRNQMPPVLKVRER